MSRLSELHKEFDYYFDDIHGDVIIAGITFSPADILKELDPVAYNEEFNSFVDNMKVDIYAEE